MVPEKLTWLVIFPTIPESRDAGSIILNYTELPRVLGSPGQWAGTSSMGRRRSGEEWLRSWPGRIQWASIEVGYWSRRTARLGPQLLKARGFCK